MSGLFAQSTAVKVQSNRSERKTVWISENQQQYSGGGFISALYKSI